MKRTRPARWTLPVAALAASLAASCSLMVDFDLEGKPCDDLGQCLEGYVCSKERVCLLAEELPAGDGGLRDGGRPDAR